MWRKKEFLSIHVERWESWKIQDAPFWISLIGGKQNGSRDFARTNAAIHGSSFVVGELARRWSAILFTLQGMYRSLSQQNYPPRVQALQASKYINE